jgi:hypothetical protein
MDKASLQYENYFDIVVEYNSPKNKEEEEAVEKAWKFISAPIQEELKLFVKKFYNKLCLKHPECKNMSADIICRRILDIVVSETWEKIEEMLNK